MSQAASSELELLKHASMVCVSAPVVADLIDPTAYKYKATLCFESKNSDSSFVSGILLSKFLSESLLVWCDSSEP